MSNNILKITFIAIAISGLLNLNAQNKGIALNFDGIDDYVLSSYDGILDSSARTMEAWIKTTGNYDPNNGGKQGVIANYGDVKNSTRWTFNVLFNNAIRIEVAGNGISGKIAVNDGKWHHVAVTYDPKDTLDYRLYVDGTLDVAGNLTIATNTVKSVPLILGVRIDYINYFEGSIDEFRMYNYALSPAEIAKNRNNEICDIPKSMVAYLKLNDGRANFSNFTKKTALDFSSNAKNASLYNFALSGSASNWVDGAGLLGGPSETRISAFHCDSVRSPSSKYLWLKDGLYRDTLQSVFGCDSVILVNVNIGRDSAVIPIVACGKFVSPLGLKCTADTFITEYYSSINACDSIVSYNISILTQYEQTVPISTCEKFTSPLGSVVISDSMVTDSFIAQSGCDSLIHYLVTIYKNKYNTDTLNACDSLIFLGNTYLKSQWVQHKYATYLGCDSFQTTLVRISPSYFNSIEVQACDSFTSNTGTTYYNSRTITERFTSKNGCDSTVETKLTIFRSAAYFDTLSACEPIILRDSLYTRSTTIYYWGKSENGCDSLRITLLNIEQINNQIDVQDSMLNLQETDWTEIQWYDCKTSENIGKDNTARILIPYSGEFKAKIMKNDCEKWTACVSSQRTNARAPFKSSPIIVFPNPNTGSFQIAGLNAQDHIYMFDNQGKALNFNRNTFNQAIFEIPNFKGWAIIQIYSDSETPKVLKILIEE